MSSPVFYGKAALLVFSACIFHFFEKNYMVFFFLFSFLGLAAFFLLHVFHIRHVLASSGFLVLFPLFFLAADLREKLHPAPESIPEEIFLRKENGKLTAYTGTIHLKKMISPGMFLADFEISHKDEGYFPRLSKAEYYKKKYSSTKGSLANLRWRKIKDIRKSYSIVVFLQKLTYFEGCSVPIQLYGRTGLLRLKEDSFGDYLRRKGGRGMLYMNRQTLPGWDCSSLHPSGAFKKFLYDLLRRCRAEGEVRDITLGILLGKSGYLAKDFKNSALQLGILHLFAASGLHLGILYVCLYAPLAALFGKRHPLALLLPLPLCFFYMMLLVFPISLMRAFSFLLFNGMKSVLHRRLTVGNYIINTALFLFLLSPGEMVSLSGILSFAAVSGILLFQKNIQELFFMFRGKLLGYIASHLSVSISAGLMITPLLIYVFHAHSFISVVFNVLAVPAVSLLLPFVFSGVILQLLPGLAWIGEGVLLAALYGMKLFVHLIQFFSDSGYFMRFSSWNEMPFYASVISIFSIVCYSILSRNRRKAYRLHFFLLFSITLLITGPPGYCIFYR